MSTPHYKQIRFNAFQSTNLGRVLIAINRASPTSQRPDGRYNYNADDLKFAQSAADILTLDSFEFLLSPDLILEKAKQENGTILLTDLSEIELDSPTKFSGVTNSTPVSYDLTSELLTVWEWALYDENAKYTLRIVREKNDTTHEHLFCGDFKRKDFRFTNVGITGKERTATELTQFKKVTIKAAPLVERLKSVLVSDISWSYSDFLSTNVQIQNYGGLYIQDGYWTDSQFKPLVDQFTAGGNPQFNIALSGYGGRATGTLSGGSIGLPPSGFADGDTVTIDGKVYTFQTALTNVNGHVQRNPGNYNLDLRNLLVAINRDPAYVGTAFGSNMTKHPTVEADPAQLALILNPSSLLLAVLVVKSIYGGVSANSIAVSVSNPSGMNWTTPTLTGGTDQSAVAQPFYFPFRTHSVNFGANNGYFPAGEWNVTLLKVFQKILLHPDVAYTILGNNNLPITFFNQKWNAGTNSFDIDETTPVNTLASTVVEWNTLFGYDPNIGFQVTDATNATPIVITVSLTGTSGTDQDLAYFGVNTGNKYQFMDIGGNTAANGVYTVTRLSANTLQLEGSAGNGAYTSGGTMASFISTPVTLSPDATLLDALKDQLYGTGFLLECSVDSAGEPQVYLRDRRSLTGTAIPAAVTIVGDSDPTTEEDFIPPPVIILQYKGDSDKLYVVRKPLPDDTTINITIPFRNHPLADANGDIYGRHLMYNRNNRIYQQAQMRFLETGSTLLTNVPSGWFNGCLLYALKNGTDATDILPPASVSDESVKNVNGDALFALTICQYKSETSERTNYSFANGENLLWTYAQYYANALNAEPTVQISRTYNKLLDGSNDVGWWQCGVSDSFAWNGVAKDWEAVKITLSLRAETAKVSFVEQPDYTTLKTYKIIPEGIGGTGGGGSSNSTGSGSTGAGTTVNTAQTDAVIIDPLLSTRNIIKSTIDVSLLTLRDSTVNQSQSKFIIDNLDGSIVYGGIYGFGGTLSAGKMFFSKTKNGFEFLPYGTSAGNTGELRFLELAANGTNYVAWKSPDSLAANNTYVFPSAYPSVGTASALLSNTTGTTSWIDINSLLSVGSGLAISSTTVGSFTGTLISFGAGAIDTILPSQTGNSGKFLTTNGTNASWATSSGLTNWVDALTTAAPNATIPVASLTVTNAATNVDAAIRPKGTGAFILAIPDNTTTGGNKRGAYAVDLQLKRSVNSYVASGTSSGLFAGEDNTATNGYAVVLGGIANIASGLYSIVSGGRGNTASGDHAHVAGYGNVSSGSYGAIPGGYGLTLSNPGNFGYQSGGASTRAMTIATDNIATFGNVDLWLANNDNSARSLLFYAPYNTAGAFPNGTKFVGFKAGVVTTSITYTLPVADGTSGYVLSTNGSGALSWISPATVSTGAVIISPASASRNLVLPTAAGVIALELKPKSGETDDILAIYNQSATLRIGVTHAGLLYSTLGATITTSDNSVPALTLNQGSTITSYLLDARDSTNTTQFAILSDGSILGSKSATINSDVNCYKLAVGTTSPTSLIHILSSTDGIEEYRFDDSVGTSRRYYDHITTTNNTPTVFFTFTTANDTAYKIKTQVLVKQTNIAAGEQYHAAWHTVERVFRNIGGTLTGIVTDQNSGVNSDISIGTPTALASNVNGTAIEVKFTGVGGRNLSIRGWTEIEIL